MLTRRTVLTTAIAAAVPLSISEPAAASHLPKLDMEALIKAAQIDPRRPDQTITPGSYESVLLVEQALRAKGFLSEVWVDGHFGTKTIEAYAAYQRSLGYTGLDASGLPGRTSLRKLGRHRYTVIRELTPGSKLTYHGVLMNTRTKEMLLAAEQLLGMQLTITQGSYNPGGDPTSAGTHDGGGALDISVDGMSPSLRTDVARQLRRVGYAAWVRTPAQGNWPYHIHAIALADTDQSGPARNQAGDYYLGLNGLANQGPDDGPEVTPILTWEEYQRAL